MRNFEKVSKVKELLFHKKNKKSAGYDFFAPWGGVTLNQDNLFFLKLVSNVK